VEQIAKLIDDAEREAYARGYADAIAYIAKTAAAASKPAETAKPVAAIAARRGRPASKAIAIVRDLIRVKPGLKGVDIFRALQKQGTPVLERTMRSCLRRLSMAGAIIQRDGRWYPKQTDAGADDRGAALLATAH
ncbi:MAG: hypothetical protein ACREXT_19895, partial [Gammaproteobacteria bacterium]